MAAYWENSCSFGLRYVSWYKYLIVSLVFSHLGFWSGNLFLIAPFPGLCLLVFFFFFFFNGMTITTMGRYRFYSDLPVTILLNKITHCAHQLKLQTYNVYQQNFNKKKKKKKKKIIFRWWGLNELPISLTIAMTNKCCICDLNHSAMILGLFT